ncbi:MAG: hypothetical protein ACREP2_00345 [Rhodanobacteraceae bacterium]
MSAWLLAAIGLLPPLIAAVVCAGRGGASARLIALQFAAALVVFLLVLLEYAFVQPSLLSLALTLAMLGLPGMLVLALFRERWL